MRQEERGPETGARSSAFPAEIDDETRQLALRISRSSNAGGASTSPARGARRAQASTTPPRARPAPESTLQARQPKPRLALCGAHA